MGLKLEFQVHVTGLLNTRMLQAFNASLFYTSKMHHVIYFSLYLYKLGIAPQIQDLLGKVAFTGNIGFS